MQSGSKRISKSAKTGGMLEERLRRAANNPAEMAATLRNFLETERSNKTLQMATIASENHRVICMDRLRAV